MVFHILYCWQPNIPQDVFGSPKSLNIKHSKCIDDILSSQIQNFAISTRIIQKSFVQVWWVKGIQTPMPQ